MFALHGFFVLKMLSSKKATLEAEEASMKA